MSHWTKPAFLGACLALTALAPAAAAPYFPPPPGLTLTTGAPTNPLMLKVPRKVHLDPRYMRQVVAFTSNEAAGTIVIRTGEKFLYLVLDGGHALRYGIGTARTGFEWSGVHTVSNKREWPDWTPPSEMRQRRPDIPAHMAGGINNPLGARALYIGSTLYRIHGTNEPWTIGGDVSSGCIRMVNDDVIDLYGRVKIGAKVIVL